MNARFAILTFFALAVSIFTLISTFNYAVDPMCYYRCQKLDMSKMNVNTYYHVGQIILAHPDADLVMIGSSRGETTSPLWLEKVTGHKALNLSVGGTELQAKFAFLNIALERSQIHQVVWQADFFELIPEILDIKMKNTEALKSYLKKDFPEIEEVSFVNQLKSLFDHVTFDASVARFKKKNQKPLDQGSGSDLNFEGCASPDFKSEKTTEALNKDIVGDYDRYRLSIFNHPASERYWNLFVEKMKYLSSQNIDVTVLIAPYNPTFMKNLADHYPDVYAAHLAWVQKMEALRIPHIQIVNYFAGIPGDDQSVQFWGDGVHFTCKGAMIMLKPALSH